MGLKEGSLAPITSPTELMALRHAISCKLLLDKYSGPEALGLADQAIAQGILGSDEIDYLSYRGKTLPSPWAYGKRPNEKIALTYHEFKETLGKENWVIFMTCDGINAGHLSVINQARERCGPKAKLILILDSDFMGGHIKSKPGDIRPKLPLHQRLYMASQIPEVDKVWYVSYPTTIDKLLFELAYLHNASSQMSEHLNVPQSVYIHIPGDKKRRIQLPRLSYESIVSLHHNRKVYELPQGGWKADWLRGIDEFIRLHLGVLDFDPQREDYKFIKEIYPSYSSL